jgi:hypothetical protein
MLHIVQMFNAWDIPHAWDIMTHAAYCRVIVFCWCGWCCSLVFLPCASALDDRSDRTSIIQQQSQPTTNKQTNKHTNRQTNKQTKITSVAMYHYEFCFRRHTKNSGRVTHPCCVFRHPTEVLALPPPIHRTVQYCSVRYCTTSTVQGFAILISHWFLRSRGTSSTEEYQ